MLRVILVDDEPAAREVLGQILKMHFPEIQVVATCKDLQECVHQIKKQQPDVVFLDIEMPGESGLNLFKYFEPDTLDFILVFTTAYSDYALQALKLSAVDYLLKPLQVHEIRRAIDKILLETDKRHALNRMKALSYNIQQDYPKQIVIPTQTGSDFIFLKDLIYLEASGSYTKFFVQAQRDGQIYSKNLKHFETLLQEEPDFKRVHRSYVVNLKHLKSYDNRKFLLRMSNGNSLPIAKERSHILDNFPNFS